MGENLLAVCDKIGAPDLKKRDTRRTPSGVPAARKQNAYGG
jgi:hypothetical protein